MNRRDILRGAGVSFAAGFAGCSGLNTGGEAALEENPETSSPSETETLQQTASQTKPPTESPPESETATPSPIRAPAETVVKITDRSPAPAAPVEYEFSMVRSEPTVEHPPVIETKITNTRDAVTRLGEERQATFTATTSENEEVHLSDSGLTFDRDDGCWKYRSPTLHADVYRRLELAPGETHTTRSNVLGVQSLPDDVCLPTGTHRFEPVIVWGDADGEIDRPVDVAFALIIERR